MLDVSLIIFLKKNLRTDNPREEYLKIDLEDLSKLKLEVDLYLSMIELSEDIFRDDNEF